PAPHYTSRRGDVMPVPLPLACRLGSAVPTFAALPFLAVGPGRGVLPSRSRLERLAGRQTALPAGVHRSALSCRRCGRPRARGVAGRARGESGSPIGRMARFGAMVATLQADAEEEGAMSRAGRKLALPAALPSGGLLRRPRHRLTLLVLLGLGLAAYVLGPTA